MNDENHPGTWAMIKQAYEGLVHTVIRPQRVFYSVDELGPTQLMIGDCITIRDDLKLKNPANYTLECSWWKPKTNTSATKLPCIIVLHGNSSCRLGSLEIVTFAIPAGFTVFALDFCGSGLSQGKYVSLGYHEQEDIATAIKYLRSTGEVDQICLWGRSMGSVASLLYAQQGTGEVSAMVLDSPFSSLPQLATELVEDGKLGVPKIAVKVVMRLIRRDIKQRAKFDMFKLAPVDKMTKLTVPSFFVVGIHDELVGPHHVELLHKLHHGPKQFFKFPGGHNSPRPINLFIDALQFLRVMVGLLPVPMETFSSLDYGSPLSPRCSSSSPKRPAPVKQFKNPLPEGMSVEHVHTMSVKELKEAVATAGYRDVSCIEKNDLVDLVLKLHTRYLRSVDAMKKTHSPSHIRTSSMSEPKPFSPSPSRRYSESNVHDENSCHPISSFQEDQEYKTTV